MIVVRLIIAFLAACTITCSVVVASSLACDPTNGSASESKPPISVRDSVFIYDVSGPTYRIRQIYFAGDMHAGPDDLIVSSPLPAHRRKVVEALPPWRGDSATTIDDMLAIWRSWPKRAYSMPFSRQLIAHGWPLLAFETRHTFWVARTTGTAVTSHDVESGHQWSSSPLKVLPWSPLWPGLLLNIAFYTITLLLAEKVYRIARKHQRLRRGLCFTCGYDRGFNYSTPCPECGGTIPNTQTGNPDPPL